MDTGVKSPLDSQRAALLLGDKCRVKDDGKHTKLQLHCIKCIPKCPGETQVQTLPSSLEKKKKKSSFSLTLALAACQEFGSNFCMDFQTF